MADESRTSSRDQAQNPGPGIGPQAQHNRCAPRGKPLLRNMNMEELDAELTNTNSGIEAYHTDIEDLLLNKHNMENHLRACGGPIWNKEVRLRERQEYRDMILNRRKTPQRDQLEGKHRDTGARRRDRGTRER